MHNPKLTESGDENQPENKVGFLNAEEESSNIATMATCSHTTGIITVGTTGAERAECIAIKNSFPSATIRGCLFHWKKTLIEHFDKIPGYKTDITVRDILHAAFGVAFVPTEHVEYIKRALQVHQSTLLFIQYFERSWLYNPNLHPHYLWNYYTPVLQCHPRTNNP